MTTNHKFPPQDTGIIPGSHCTAWLHALLRSNQPLMNEFLHVTGASRDEVTEWTVRQSRSITDAPTDMPDVRIIPRVKTIVIRAVTDFNDLYRLLKTAWFGMRANMIRLDDQGGRPAGDVHRGRGGDKGVAGPPAALTLAAGEGRG